MELAWFTLHTLAQESTVRAVFPRASPCVRKKDMSEDWISSVGSHASSIISRKEQGKTGILYLQILQSFGFWCIAFRCASGLQEIGCEGLRAARREFSDDELKRGVFNAAAVSNEGKWEAARDMPVYD